MVQISVLMDFDFDNEINIILDGTNYAYWSHLMQNFLKGKNLCK